MKRDPWLDNVKMVLVTFVVIGHVLPMVPDAGGPGLRSQLYDFIYFWHIPAFVLVTGYFSRSFTWSRRHLTALFTTIGIPFLLFEFLMIQFRTHAGGETVLDPMWINPHWPMWYLIAVLLWRLATPVLKVHWVMVPLSVALSLWFGNSGSVVFDLDRVVGLLPFFTLGLHLGPAALSRLRSTAARLVAVPALVSLWFLADTTNDWMGSSRWLWYSWNYERLGATFAEGVELRAKLMAIGLVGTLAVIASIPRKGGWFTAMGQWTLVVYLFHGFFVRGALYLDYPVWAREQGNWTLWPSVLAAVALALLLAWKPVATRLNLVVDPVGSWQRHRAGRRTKAA